MVTDVDNSDFFSDFLDDYFAESDEHLTAVRRNLLQLESFVQNPPITRSLLDDLFRSFHTLKGLSGMVGVKEAEQLAHDMESYLRVLRDEQIILTSEGMDALINGTKMLEQVIANCRTQNSAPDISPVVNQILAVLPKAASPVEPISDSQADKREVEISPSVTGEDAPKLQSLVLNTHGLKLKDQEIDQLQAAFKNNLRAWHFEFVPSNILSERGINVNTVRDRLQQLGQLIHSTPRVMAGGGIIFDFIVTSSADETTFAGWDNDGMSWTLLELNAQPEPKKSKEPEEQESVKDEENISSSSFPSKQPGNTATTSVIAPSNVVRVDLAKLDELMRMVGELVISRSRLEDNLARLEGIVPAPQMRPLRETNLALERQLRELRDGVMRVRLVPIGEVFARMQFVVRDLARESKKQVLLELSGQETEIDKFVVERMMDPLLHLVRNSVSHGLETETERIAQGKSPGGKLSLRASTAGEMVIIEIEDDGRGVDVEKVAKTGRKLGLISDDVIPDPATILDLICSPGFSTRDQADLTSGRGVGMAVVKSTILELGGDLSFDTKPGAGTYFRIELPLTLAIADAFIITVAGHTFAIPQSSVREVIEIEATTIKILQNNEILFYRSGVLPLIRLSHIFKLENRESVNGNGKYGSRGVGRDKGDKGDKEDIFDSHQSLVTDSNPKSKIQNPKFFHALVVGNGLDQVGILVDRILGQQEIVVRALTDPLLQVPGISGATELGDGRVVLILDAGKLKSHNSKLKAFDS